ncbi:MAG TPA: GNAT family N-acetyltransferase [Candidatus Bathyarchaeia archaeon]|nr:GNAT family N-acetyltransferase [Candidatus Bathyarchaeia archaeon]
MQQSRPTGNIRAMVQADFDARLDQIMKLALLANPKASRDLYKQYILKIFKEFPNLAFVAVDDDKLVGFVMGSLQEEQGEIEDLAIIENHRRKGLGKKLVESVVSAMKSSGAKRALVWVTWRNTASIPFYYGIGFRFLHCERDKVTPGETADVIYLEKYM